MNWGVNISIFDPVADMNKMPKKYKEKIVTAPHSKYYHGTIIAVPHKAFLDFGLKNILNLCHNEHVLFDLKGIFPIDKSDFRL